VDSVVVVVVGIAIAGTIVVAIAGGATAVTAGVPTVTTVGGTIAGATCGRAAVSLWVIDIIDISSR